MGVAEREHLEEDTVCGGNKGKHPGPGDIGIGRVSGRVYTDGSRTESRTAAATTTRAEYRGRYTTVIDTEMIAVAMHWELGDTVITTATQR